MSKIGYMLCHKVARWLREFHNVKLRRNTGMFEL